MASPVTRSRRALAAVAAAAALAACAPDWAPTAVRAAGRGRLNGEPGDYGDLQARSRFLYSPPEAARLRLADSLDIDRLVALRPESPEACGATAGILDRLFASYFAYDLFGQAENQYGGPYLTAPRREVQGYVVALSTRCSRVAPPNGVPDAVLDVNGGVGVVTPERGGTVETVASPGGQAGARIQPGTFSEPVLLYITPIVASLRLPTTLPQFTPYYDIGVVPAQPRPYAKPVDLGVVVNWPDRPPSDHLLLGHEFAPGQMTVVQPTFLVTPSSGAGRFGGPAYLRPPQQFAASVAAPSGVTAFARIAGTTTSVGGQASELSPFGLVSIAQPGVSPSAAVSFDQSYCSYGGVVPFNVKSAADIVLSYQEVSGAGALIGPRRTRFLAGVGNSGTPRGETVRASSAQTRSVRFYYGAVLFATRTVPACSS